MVIVGHKRVNVLISKNVKKGITDTKDSLTVERLLVLDISQNK